ncbi:MAG: sulfate/molybdate ABC transporter ATP-binding protein [Aristaeellaceae bacterium]
MSLSVCMEKTLGAFHLDVSFETDGGTLGLLGASGCGKSMTLKCIAGIETPDKGRIILNGVTLFDSEKHINLPPQRRRVGYLFQNYALFPSMTVRQNILCGLCHVKDKGEKERRLARAVELMKISDLLSHKPHQLSGGQAQRTALARILVSEPQMLLLDEPFSALDSHLRLYLQMELKTLLESFGHDVIIVTHSRDEAYHMCDRIAVVDEGRLLTVKPTKALFADPGSIRAAMLTGCKNIAKARKTGEYEVEVPQWGIRLHTAQPVQEGIAGVGIRAHYFNARAAQNRYPIVYAGEMEEPFEWTVRFRFAGQDESSEALWWRVTKDKRPQAFPEAFGIAPSNILLLY